MHSGIEGKLETKAERDIAVAAASVIARDTFLTGIENFITRVRVPIAERCISGYRGRKRIYQIARC